MRNSKSGRSADQGAKTSPLVRLRGYVLALAAVGAAAALRHALSGFFGSGLVYITFYPAVMLAATLGGFGPGLLATVAAALLAAYWIIPPQNAFLPMTTPDAVGLAVFATMGSLISLVAELYHRARRKVAAYEQELALRQTQARLAGIVGSAMDAIITVDAEQRIVLFNAAAEKMFRCPAAEALGQPLERFIPVRHRAAHRDHVRNFGATGVTARAMGSLGALTALRADGQEFPVEASISQIEVAGQKLFTVILRDITERVQAHEALQRSHQELEQRVAERTVQLRDNEARYRSLVTASAQIVWTTDAQGNIAGPLPTWQAFTGQTFDQYQDSGWVQALHPEDREPTAAVWARALSARSLYETQYRLRRHDGQYRYVAARGVPVLEANGAIREWVGTCTDITERKEAERRRDFTGALLGLFAQKGSAKEYLDSVVEAIRQWSGSQALGIRLVDEHQMVPYESWAGFEPGFIALEHQLSLQRDNCCCLRAISQAFDDQDRPLLTPAGSYRCDDAPAFLKQLPPDQQARFRGNCVKFGFSSLAVIPIRYHNAILGAIHLADRRPGQFPAASVEFIESMTPLIGEAVHRFQAETELARYRDHLEVLVRQRTSELQTANVRLQVEIAERQRAQETLQQTAQELARSNRDLEQFAYVASHDLQEPLRAVGGYVKLLQRRYPDGLDDKAREYIAGAVDGANRMERLIIDLLAFSRVGTRGQAFAPADLEALLDQALKNLHSSLEEAGAKVTHDPLPRLLLDASQMLQLFQNLVGNGIKFRSQRPPEIHVGAKKQQARWLLWVRDNGIGIEPQYSERIFQIFQRLHTRKQYPGTGIGLAICKRIVERHGGAIWVESQPGLGSTFYLSIPEPSGIKESGL